MTDTPPAANKSDAIVVLVLINPLTVFLSGAATAFVASNFVSFDSAKNLLCRVGSSLKGHAFAFLSQFASKRADFRSLRSKQIELYEPNSVVRVLSLSQDCSFTEVRGMAHMANEMYDLINNEEYSPVIEETTRLAKLMFEEDRPVSYSEALSHLTPRGTPSWLHNTRIELEYIDSYGSICNKLWVGKQGNVSFPSTTGAFNSDTPKLGSAILSVTFLPTVPGSDDRSQTSGYSDNLDHNEDSEDDSDDSEEDDDDSSNDSDYVPSPETDDHVEEESDPFTTESPSVMHPITPPPSQPTPFTFFDFAIFNRNKTEEVFTPAVLDNSEESTLCDEDENETDGEEEKNEEKETPNDQPTTTTPVLYDEDGKGDEDEDEVVFEADVTAVCRSWMEDKKRTSEMRHIMPFVLRDAIDCGAVLVLDVEVLLNIKLALRYTDGSEVVLEIDRKGWVTEKKKEM